MKQSTTTARTIGRLVGEFPLHSKSLEVHVSLFGARSRFVNPSYSPILCKPIYGELSTATAECGEKYVKSADCFEGEPAGPIHAAKSWIDLDVSNLQAYISSSPESLS
jgi:hypothetical protein